MKDRLVENILNNLNDLKESDSYSSDEAMEEALGELGLVYDDLNMMSEFEEDTIKFKLKPIDNLLDNAAELCEHANNLYSYLEKVKQADYNYEAE